MDRVPVNSSELANVGYDPTTSTLEVEFRTGSVYEYRQVPASVHLGLMSAPSHGKYFNQYVKKGDTSASVSGDSQFWIGRTRPPFY